LAARRLVSEVRELAAELERERARRRLPLGEAPTVDGAPLGEGIDGGEWREFLVGRPIHAGDTLYLLTTLGWQVVRYESNALRKSSVLYLSLPGVRSDVVVPVPREARFAWPGELKKGVGATVPKDKAPTLIILVLPSQSGFPERPTLRRSSGEGAPREPSAISHDKGREAHRTKANSA
jgi:hypothetical protein